jgi:hypothetical protein
MRGYANKIAYQRVVPPPQQAPGALPVGPNTMSILGLRLSSEKGSWLAQPVQ